MYSEFKLVKFNDKYDKIYLTLKNEIYFKAMEYLSHDMKKYYPQIKDIGFKFADLSVLFIVEKGTYIQILSLIDKMDLITNTIEKYGQLDFFGKELNNAFFDNKENKDKKYEPEFNLPGYNVVGVDFSSNNENEITELEEKDNSIEKNLSPKNEELLSKMKKVREELNHKFKNES